MKEFYPFDQRAHDEQIGLSNRIDGTAVWCFGRNALNFDEGYKGVSALGFLS